MPLHTVYLFILLIYERLKMLALKLQQEQASKLSAPKKQKCDNKTVEALQSTFDHKN